MAVESSAVEHATIEFVRGQLEPPPGRVLEVGCGEGGLAEVLAGAGYVGERPG